MGFDAVGVPDALDFAHADGVELGRSLGGFVLTEAAEEAVEALEFSVEHEAREEIVVHRELEFGVDVSDFFEDTATPETCLLRDQIPAHHAVVAVFGEDPVPHHFVARIDGAAVAVDDVDVGIVGEEIGDSLQRSGGEHIVAIQVAHVVTGGACEAPANCVGLAFVFFGDVIGEAVEVGFEDFLSAVFRAAVHDDVFEVGVALEEDATRGHSDVLRLIV